MRRPDLRGQRVVVVADILINPNSAFYEELGPSPGQVLDVLIEDGWGLMKAPPPLLSDEAMRASLTTIAGDVCEYVKHEHEVVVLAAADYPEGGLRLDLLAAALREVGVGSLPMLSLPLRGNLPASEIRARLAALAPAAARLQPQSA